MRVLGWKMGTGVAAQHPERVGEGGLGVNLQQGWRLQVSLHFVLREIASADTRLLPAP